MQADGTVAHTCIDIIFVLLEGDRRGSDPGIPNIKT